MMTLPPAKQLLALPLLLGLVCVLRAGAENRAQEATVTPRAPLLGAAWYPEQWPESRWEADLELMQKAHMHVVRVGEFAWTALEPHEGTYDFEWLERAVNLAGKHGIYVVLGTPTAAPPMWMATKYPDILVTEDTGRQYQGATRNHYNWNSERYRRFVRDIDERLSQRFGHNPYVIGWQIDNEYSKQSFDAETQSQFHRWLERRYGTLASLNQAWTTTYNNQTYSAWNEIPLVSGTADNSPGLWLDSKRFISDSLRAYQNIQIDAIRAHADPHQKITTNMMGWYDLYDHYIVGQDLDIIGWDNPQVSGSFQPVRNGAAHDLMRGLKSQNYWVMETTAGPRGGANASAMLDKGEMRMAMWSYIGHGADLISYWQWRDALNGGEANHGALVDVDGLPDPIYDEVRQVGEEFEKAAPLIEGTSVTATVAILHSYPSRWTVDWEKMNPAYDAIDALMSYYTPFHKAGYTIDIVPPDRDLSRYKLVIAPALEVLTRGESDNLIRYVKGGGHLVLGQRSAMKDEHDSRWEQRQPGPLAALLGARVEQYTALEQPVEVTGVWGEAKAQLFAEQLTPQNDQDKVVMRFRAPRSWLDGQPAVVTRRLGKGHTTGDGAITGNGSITYVGVWLDEPGMKRAVEWMLEDSAAVADTFPVPEGVDVYRRCGKDHDIFIIENASREQQSVKLPSPMRDVISGKTVGDVTLPVYGVSILSATKRP